MHPGRLTHRSPKPPRPTAPLGAVVLAAAVLGALFGTSGSTPSAPDQHIRLVADKCPDDPKLWPKEKPVYGPNQQPPPLGYWPNCGKYEAQDPPPGAKTPTGGTPPGQGVHTLPGHPGGTVAAPPPAPGKAPPGFKFAPRPRPANPAPSPKPAAAPAPAPKPAPRVVARPVPAQSGNRAGSGRTPGSWAERPRPGFPSGSPSGGFTHPGFAGRPGSEEHH